MTDGARGSSDEDDVDDQPQQSLAEVRALQRKKRLLEMKSRINGIEMKPEDYDEAEKPTKKSKMETKNFRSYKPISEALGKADGELRDLSIVEREIETHLKDTMDVKPVETVDITNLAPKKVDWDLKRDIEKRMQKLERRTQKAIAELIRQRLVEGKVDLASTVNSVNAAV